MKRRSFLGLASAWLGHSLVARAVEAKTIRLVSYNIHHGEGMDRKLDLARIADFLKAQNPDVVALQEVDQGCRRTGNVRQADEIARMLGMQAHFAPFMPFQGGEYGQAILSRLPVVKAWTVVLPKGAEARSSSVMKLKTSAGEVIFANIHFYDTEAERLAQAKALEEALANEAGTQVWLGDFNSQPGDGVMRYLEERGFARPEKENGPATWPADAPRENIDHILWKPKGAFRISGYRVLDERVLSDHRPIAGVLEVTQ